MALTQIQLRAAQAKLLKLYFAYVEKAYPVIWRAMAGREILGMNFDVLVESIKNGDDRAVIEAANNIGENFFHTDHNAINLVNELRMIGAIQGSPNIALFDKPDNKLFIDGNDRNGVIPTITPFFESILPGNRIFDKTGRPLKLVELKNIPGYQNDDGSIPYIVPQGEYDAIMAIVINDYRNSPLPVPAANAHRGAPAAARQALHPAGRVDRKSDPVNPRPIPSQNPARAERARPAQREAAASAANNLQYISHVQRVRGVSRTVRLDVTVARIAQYYAGRIPYSDICAEINNPADINASNLVKGVNYNQALRAFADDRAIGGKKPKIEADHDFVQILFPNMAPSQQGGDVTHPVIPNPPALRDYLVEHDDLRREIEANLAAAVDLMVEHFKTLNVPDGQYDHNYARITRIIETLGIFNHPRKSELLQKIYDSVIAYTPPKTSLNHWADMANEFGIRVPDELSEKLSLIAIAGEEYKGPAGLEQELDQFSRISRSRNLTQANVLGLIRVARAKTGIEEHVAEATDSTFSISVTGAPEVDHYLRDSILNFIGSGQDKASFALCRGRIVPGRDRPEIQGDTHWTALHLRKEGGNIYAYHMNSVGVAVPDSVGRVLASIKATPTAVAVEQDGAVNPVFARAIGQLNALTFNPCVPIQCAQQTDGVNCGYHSVFNAVRMDGVTNDQLQNHQRVPLDNTILQDGQELSINRFITDRRVNLADRFGGSADEPRERPERKSDQKRRVKIQEAKAADRVELAKLKRPEERVSEEVERFVKRIMDDKDHREQFLHGRPEFIEELSKPKSDLKEPEEALELKGGAEFRAVDDVLSIITSQHNLPVKKFETRSKPDNQLLRLFAQENATGEDAIAFGRDSKAYKFPDYSPLRNLNDGDNGAIVGCTSVELEKMKKDARVYYDDSELDENQVKDILQVKAGQKPPSRENERNANLVTMTIPSKILLDNQGTPRPNPLPVVFTNFTYPKFNNGNCFEAYGSLKLKVAQNVKKMIALNISEVNKEAALQGVKLPFILNVPGAFISRLGKNEVDSVKNCIARALSECLDECNIDNIDGFVVLGGNDSWRNQADIQTLSSNNQICVVDADMVDIAEQFHAATGASCPLPLMGEPLGAIGNGGLSDSAENAVDEFLFRACGGINGLVGSVRYNPAISNQIEAIQSSGASELLDSLKEDYAELSFEDQRKVEREFEKQYKALLLEKCIDNEVDQDLMEQVVDCDFDDLGELNADIDDNIAQHDQEEDKDDDKDDQKDPNKSELVNYFISLRKELLERKKELAPYILAAKGQLVSEDGYNYIQYNNEKELDEELSLELQGNNRDFACTPFLKYGEDKYKILIRQDNVTQKVLLNQAQVDAIVDEAENGDPSKSLDKRITKVIKNATDIKKDLVNNPAIASDFIKNSTVISKENGRTTVTFLSDDGGDFPEDHIYINLPDSDKRIRIDIANKGNKKIAVAREAYPKISEMGTKGVASAISGAAALATVSAPIIGIAAIGTVTAGVGLLLTIPLALTVGGEFWAGACELAPQKRIEEKEIDAAKGDVIIQGVVESQDGKKFTRGDLSEHERYNLDKFMKNLTVYSYHYNNRELEVRDHNIPSNSNKNKFPSNSPGVVTSHPLGDHNQGIII